MSLTGERSDGVGEATRFTQDGRLLAIETELGKDVLLLIGVDGVEAISRGFTYTVEFVTLAADAEVQTLLGTPVTLWLGHAQEARRRPLHGHVRHLTRMSLDARGYRHWRGEIVPWMWFLTCSVDCRIYQDMSVVDIVRSVFEEHGFTDHQFWLIGSYPKLAFCVQYRESAFDFVSRLLEHVGIGYWYKHAGDRHTLVLADSNHVAPFCEPRLAVMSNRSDLGDIQSIEQDFAARSGRWALSDYDFEVPTKNLTTREAGIRGATPSSRFEIFDYPGHYTSSDEGKGLTRLRIEQEEVQHFQMSGVGSNVGFDPGKRLDLDPDGRSASRSVRTYLLTEVRHSARAPIHDAGVNPPEYSNRFVCIPADVPFRPERLTAWPVVQGPQTATVVGPAGESIHVDKYGRVRLLFHWDRRGKRDEHASCWVRVSQAAAGAQTGGVSIPHVGEEVVVSFLEGDPNRPLITGRVHNGNNMPPIHLPADKDKTLLRDHGDNKIIMHGKAGKQHLSLVSPRSLNLFAVRSGAKALSAAATFVSRDGSINDVVDDFQDSQSLGELLTIFKALDNPAANSDTNKTGNTLSGPAGTADAGATIDINTMSEGNINSLSLGKTNTWVYSDANSWVNGNVWSSVQGYSVGTIAGYEISTIEGDSTSTVQGDSTASIGGDAFTGVSGNNGISVGHNNTSVVTGTNDSFLMGLSTSLIMGGAISLVTPLSVQTFLGLNAQLTLGTSYQAATTNMQLFATNISHNNINLSWDDLTIDVKDTHITKKEIQMSAHDFEVKNSDLLLFM